MDTDINIDMYRYSHIYIYIHTYIYIYIRVQIDISLDRYKQATHIYIYIYHVISLRYWNSGSVTSELHDFTVHVDLRNREFRGAVSPGPQSTQIGTTLRPKYVGLDIWTLTPRLQVYRKARPKTPSIQRGTHFELWGFKSINSTYFGPCGVLG